VEVEFSEEMTVSTLRLTSVPTVSFTLASWVPESRRAVFSPSSPLNQDQQYAITVAGMDAAGNSLAGNQSFAFTTVSPAPDTTPPTLISSSPSYSAFGIPRDAKVKLTFSEPMNRASVEQAFRFTSPAGTSIGAVTWNSSGTDVEYTPRALFPYDTEIVWYLSPEATDLAGNWFNEASGTFRTVRLIVATLWRDVESHLASTEPIGTASPWPIGDTSSNRPIHGFASFSLQGLNSATQILSATLQWDYIDPGSGPFTSLGRFVVDPVSYETFSNDVFATPSISTPLLLGYHDLEVTSGIANIPVTAMVIDAWNHRASRYERAQFRLKFESWTDDDNSRDSLQLDRNSLFLKVTYEGQ
jgi:hypothetical protein